MTISSVSFSSAGAACHICSTPRAANRKHKPKHHLVAPRPHVVDGCWCFSVFLVPDGDRRRSQFVLCASPCLPAATGPGSSPVGPRPPCRQTPNRLRGWTLLEERTEGGERRVERREERQEGKVSGGGTPWRSPREKSRLLGPRVPSLASTCLCACCPLFFLSPFLLLPLTMLQGSLRCAPAAGPSEVPPGPSPQPSGLPGPPAPPGRSPPPPTRTSSGP